MFNFDLSFLKERQQPAPHYTTYPVSSKWVEVSSSFQENALSSLEKNSNNSIALVIQVPFCLSMCSYCLCSAILKKDAAREAEYVYFLLKEIDIIKSQLKNNPKISHITICGGSPTKLSDNLLASLMEKLFDAFTISEKTEITIEIDPQLVSFESASRLSFFKSIGFNRVSFGIQDIQPLVQHACEKYSMAERNTDCFLKAKEENFFINMDLVYSLPFQTLQSLTELTDHIVQLQPDRISLFSYIRMISTAPATQKTNETSIPSSEVQFQMYSRTRNTLIEQGYISIGMDLFAKKEDPLAQAYLNKTLSRNCLGYTINSSDEIIGLGLNATGFIDNCYLQNTPHLTDYYYALENFSSPIYKGYLLSSEDRLRKWVIQQIMCTFEIDKINFFDHFGITFDEKFAHLYEDLTKMEVMGFIENTPSHLYVTGLGALFIRIIAMAFDSYLTGDSTTPFIFSP